MTSTPKFKHQYQPDHPFKRGVRKIIEDHFAPQIAKNFHLFLELDLYEMTPDRTANLIKQHQQNKWVCEVHYLNPSGIAVYICDVFSDWKKSEVEYVLLKYITDKYKTGAIGKDWGEKDGKIDIDVIKGIFETPDSELEKGTIKEVVKK